MDVAQQDRSNKRHWVNTLFLSGTLVAALTAVPLYFLQSGFSWQWALVIIASVHATNLSITAGYHRYLSHRAFDAQPWVKALLLLFGASAFQGSALNWARDHRRHHRFVDTDQDPHNIRKGFLWAHVGWLLEAPEAPTVEYAPDLTRDALVVWQDKHYVTIAIAMGFGLPFLIGCLAGSPMGGLVFGGVVRILLSNHCTFLINSLAHTVGSRPYSDHQTARDNTVLAVLACGEGYHNFHHVFAADYRNGVKWYHWDPTKWFIRALSLFGMTYRLRRVSASEILRARLQTEQHRLIARGLPADRVAAMKQKVEEAQLKWRALREDYQVLKKNVQAESQRRLDHLRAELKVARSEFKTSFAQWGTFYRAFHALPVYSPT